MKFEEINLGMKVICRVTGATGVVTCKSEHLGGPQQVRLEGAHEGRPWEVWEQASLVDPE
ncbi:MAG: hypothetical protein RI885_2282 [Actinomycetota bacterium]|jgi:hypothetical protein